jgi:hypothetical protein
MNSPERQLEEELIEKLRCLKYEYREDIRDRATLEKNFREKFQALNQVKLTDAEFEKLLTEIVTPDVFTTAHTLRNRNSFTRDDGCRSGIEPPTGHQQSAGKSSDPVLPMIECPCRRAYSLMGQKCQAVLIRKRLINV